ncbi:recombination regulator RecX [Bacillus sp. T33-2]|uniref:recombination regulator RecX n=1 Tax=Bacillus sp. T33-2 TaxID=2054168 RepID=UPI000C775B16|nr:recombination regulator RecX [Bacillus sp. T33-2]PLR95393.1 recombination regulator RecX [Bacillus sp. T33-2]
MPVISKIIVQKNNKERYSIFIDSGKGEEYAFGVDEDVLIKFQLKKGMELDDLSITELLYQDDIRKAYHLAVQYLARRMRSESEVRDYLQKKEVAAPVIEEAIHRLYEQKFLNDKEFAHAFVRTQMNTTDKGSQLIKAELKEKGIAGSIIDDSIKEYPEEMQLEKAVQLCSKYAAKNSRDSTRVLKQKLEQMLVRKGYSFGLIQAALNETEIDKPDEDEMLALKHHGDKLHRKYASLSGFEQRQKIKQALFRKGFAIEQIDCYLDGLEDSE